MGPMEPGRADLPVAARTTDHLERALADLTDAQVSDRLAGFDAMLAELPADDDVMRPTIEALADVLAVELAVRQRSG
jgi:hypothetical protein